MTPAEIIKGLKVVRTIHNGNYAPFIDGAIKELKAREWIPVSEKLPEDGTYLVTVGGMVGESSIDMKSFAKDLNRVDEYDFWNKQGKAGWYGYDSEYGYWEDTRVIAWMPLPKPYKPQERSEKE